MFFDSPTNIMTYINTPTDKYQNNIVKQSYLILKLFHKKSIPLHCYLENSNYVKTQAANL